MGLIVFAIIWYNLMGKKIPAVSNFIKGKGGIIAIVILALIFFSSFPLFLLISFGGGPILFIVLVVVLVTKRKSFTPQQQQGTRSTPGRVSTLTKVVSKRRKIVEKFNEEYSLRLTREQIEIMVNASYANDFWEEEIEDMDKKYNTVYEWFNTDDAWVRAYLYIFNVQEVAYDYEGQRTICYHAFDQVFSSIDFRDYYNRKDMLWDINNRFLTRFDEVTFMIAYRFLERQGKKYNIYVNNVVKNEDEADVLKRKYDKM